MCGVVRSGAFGCTAALMLLVAGLTPGSGLAKSDNPLLGIWRFDHVEPQAESVDASKLRRVRGAVAPLQTIDVAFGRDRLTLTKPGGDTTTYKVDYRVDRVNHTVTMTEHRQKQTVQQTYHLAPDQLDRMYTARTFGPVGRVHMVYKRVSNGG